MNDLRNLPLPLDLEALASQFISLFWKSDCWVEAIKCAISYTTYQSKKAPWLSLLFRIFWMPGISDIQQNHRDCIWFTTAATGKIFTYSRSNLVTPFSVTITQYNGFVRSYQPPRSTHLGQILPLLYILGLILWCLLERGGCQGAGCNTMIFSCPPSAQVTAAG